MYWTAAKTFFWAPSVSRIMIANDCTFVWSNAQMQINLVQWGYSWTTLYIHVESIGFPPKTID